MRKIGMPTLLKNEAPTLCGRGHASIPSPLSSQVMKKADHLRRHVLCVAILRRRTPRKNDDLRRRKGKKANDLRRHTLCVAILRRRPPGRMMTCDAEKAKRPTTCYGRGQKADDLRRKGLGHGARRDGGVNWGLTAQRGRRY